MISLDLTEQDLYILKSLVLEQRGAFKNTGLRSQYTECLDRIFNSLEYSIRSRMVISELQSKAMTPITNSDLNPITFAPKALKPRGWFNRLREMF